MPYRTFPVTSRWVRTTTNATTQAFVADTRWPMPDDVVDAVASALLAEMAESAATKMLYEIDDIKISLSDEFSELLQTDITVNQKRNEEEQNMKQISRVAPGWVEKEVFRFSALKSHITDAGRDAEAVLPAPVDLEFTGSGGLFSGHVYNSDILECIPFLVKGQHTETFDTLQAMLEKHAINEELLRSNGNQEWTSKYLTTFLYGDCNSFWSAHSTSLERQPSYDVYGALLKAANDALLLHLTWYKEAHWSTSTVISYDRFQKPERRQKRRVQKLMRSLRSAGWDIPMLSKYFCCRSDSEERKHRRECQKDMARKSVSALVYGASAAKLRTELASVCDFSKTSVICISNNMFKTEVGGARRVKALHPSLYVSNTHGAYVTSSVEEAKRVFSAQVKFSGIAQHDIDNICKRYRRLHGNFVDIAYHSITFKQAEYDAWSMRMPEPAVKAIWNNCTLFHMSCWGMQETGMPVSALHISAHFGSNNIAMKIGVENVAPRSDVYHFDDDLDAWTTLNDKMEEAASGHSAIL